MFEFTLYLIRHGESEGNIHPDIIGQTPDVPLTERGKEQARALKKSFLKKNEKFDFIFSSTYKRAHDTCLLAIPDDTQKTILVPELREYNPGDWLGKSRRDIYTPDVVNKMNIMGQDFCPPNGESCTMVERRAAAWLEEAVINNKDMHRYYDEHGKMKIACFSHGGTIKSLLHYIMNFDKSLTWKIKISNTSISKISFADGWLTMHYVNNTAHLEV
jgi:broad specificity phosphatase PhoE